MKLTPIIIIVFVVGLLGYDGFIIMKEGKLESVSAYLIRWYHEYPSLSFLSGYVFGHLTWSMKTSDWKRPEN